MTTEINFHGSKSSDIGANNSSETLLGLDRVILNLVESSVNGILSAR